METLSAYTWPGTSSSYFKTAKTPRERGIALSVVPRRRGYLHRDRGSVRDSVSEAVIDVLRIGIIVVDSSRQVVRQNRHAVELLQKSIGMKLCDGRLATELCPLNRRLSAIISAACQDSVSSEFFIASEIEAGADLKLYIRIIPLSAGAGLAAVFMSQSDGAFIPVIGAHVVTHSPIDLRQIPGLAPSERW